MGNELAFDITLVSTLFPGLRCVEACDLDALPRRWGNGISGEHIQLCHCGSIIVFATERRKAIYGEPA